MGKGMDWVKNHRFCSTVEEHNDIVILEVPYTASHEQWEEIQEIISILHDHGYVEGQTKRIDQLQIELVGFKIPWSQQRTNSG
ncbi:hypothetical protein CHL76_13110 [Marinococcus halophilus]|uniref:Uncharacterized protein n=1 Tax=Marinococcus halophilus TaxID=1371 RepID=A0A510Y8A0_MARHA|nr:hypothetical protein [Marinococcus halophilus]OZT79349.1 hypothetical protein CHL76_13110 [Marinococcus halophilus]GEK59602.1 hypothetical protein MHA01_25070 [Marinococcus halophilus]